MQPEKVLSNAVNIPSYLFIFILFIYLLLFLNLVSVLGSY